MNGWLLWVHVGKLNVPWILYESAKIPPKHCLPRLSGKNCGCFFPSKRGVGSNLSRLQGTHPLLQHFSHIAISRAKAWNRNFSPPRYAFCVPFFWGNWKPLKRATIAWKIGHQRLSRRVRSRISFYGMAFVRAIRESARDRNLHRKPQSRTNRSMKRLFLKKIESHNLIETSGLF